MLIRTQDKRSLVDMTGMTLSIPYEGVGSKSEIRAISNQTGSWKLLGIYSTEEKAIEVLDIIHSKYILNYRVFDMPDDEEV